MKNASFKPVLVPTMYSSRVLLWSISLVALFGALMWAYCTWGALVRARARLSEPVQTVVDMPFYSVKLPLGWNTYSRDGNALAVFRTRGKDTPVVFLFSERDPGYPYHALDVNPAIALRIVEEDIEAVGLSGLDKDISMGAIGSEQLTVKPGITALRMLFDVDQYNGEAVIFYAGDVRYVLWGLWEDGDRQSEQEIHEFFRHLFEGFTIPEMRESIDRPVVHSGKLTAELNAATHLQVGRETALWRLFAARAETEPEVALLPALRHYREALRLLSSIRQEHVALVSDDFKRYQKLLEERRMHVAEWFVVLEKAVAMRDWPKARRQAKWIMDHATLTGERVDVRRAADILATKIPPEDGESSNSK